MRNCEEVREQLPDYALGTMPETEAAAVRRHLRGCGGCRADAERLDEGLAMFAGAAHAVDPPPDLKGRVLGVLEEEWAEPGPAVGHGRGGGRRGWFRDRAWPLAFAAAAVALAGALAWGSIAQSSAGSSRAALGEYAGAAREYQAFLHALGGKDVRVASLHPTGRPMVSGTAVLYDSDRAQSWVLVLAQAPGRRGTVRVRLLSSAGRSIDMMPMTLDSRGDGSAWLVTSSNISSFDSVQLVDPSTGAVLASGRTPPVRAG